MSTLTQTYQSTQPTQTALQPIKDPGLLPTLISNVKPAKGGYRVYANGKWTYYAACCLDSQTVTDLEDWLDELRPGGRSCPYHPTGGSATIGGGQAQAARTQAESGLK